MEEVFQKYKKLHIRDLIRHLIAELQFCLEENTKGYFFCMQGAAKRMKEGGRIINIATSLSPSHWGE